MGAEPLGWTRHLRRIHSSTVTEAVNAWVASFPCSEGGPVTHISTVMGGKETFVWGVGSTGREGSNFGK